MNDTSLTPTLNSDILSKVNIVDDSDKLSQSDVAEEQTKQKLQKTKDKKIETLKPPLPSKPGLDIDDSMAEAARKIFLFHFGRMIHHEPGTRLGEDIESLHDMRVATRRMRAAMNIFETYLDPNVMAPFLKGMKQTRRALGAVRDLDVFWEKTESYFQTIPTNRQTELDLLRNIWQSERESARKNMLCYLNSKKYSKFKKSFGAFLKKPCAGALPVWKAPHQPRPHRLHHVIPFVIYERLADVRAYDEWVTEPDAPIERLHQLRIACKGLRYTLEYFQEVLDPVAKELITEIKMLQDHLGDLQDAEVASDILLNILKYGSWKQEKKFVTLPKRTTYGITAYMATRQRELNDLVETFPKTWNRLKDCGFDEKVSKLILKLSA